MLPTPAARVITYDSSETIVTCLSTIAKTWGTSYCRWNYGVNASQLLASRWNDRKSFHVLKVDNEIRIYLIITRIHRARVFKSKEIFQINKNLYQSSHIFQFNFLDLFSMTDNLLINSMRINSKIQSFDWYFVK